MKKILSIILVLAMVAALAACASRGGSSSEPDVSDPDSEAVSTQASSVPAAPKSYSVEEAAKLNATLDDSEIKLVQTEEPNAAQPVATIKTSAGDITIVLYPEEAPKAVENFISHAKSGYYNGQSFYKAIENFVIQTGKPDGADAKSASGEPFESEYSLNLWSFRGALVMVNDGAAKPHTNKSEFMIVQPGFVSAEIISQMEAANYPEKVLEHYKEVGGLPGFDWHNTVFGMVTEGMEVVDAIAAAELGEDGNPAKPVIIHSIAVRGQSA